MTWEFLDKEWEVISQAPISIFFAIFLLLFPLAGAIYWVFEIVYRGKINGLEGQIELLRERLEGKQNEPTEQLEENEIRALERIESFERRNPRVGDRFPNLYAVEQLQADLSIEWWEANEIIRRLKALDLAYCPWENESIFMDRSRPIGEEKPVMLTNEGRYRLYAHKRKR